MGNYLELIDRYLSLLLATTTWLAIYPAIDEKGGAMWAVAACGVSAAIEFTGYVARRASAREFDRSLAIYGLVIIIGSATFTFWGGRLTSALIEETMQSDISDEYTAGVMEITKRESADKQAYNRSYQDFLAQKKKAIDKIWKEEFPGEIKGAISHYEVARKVLRGEKLSWYLNHDSPSVSEPAKLAQKIREKYQAKEADIRATKFDLQAPSDYSPILDELTADKDVRKKSATVMAATTNKIIVVIDIIGGLFGLVFFLRSLDEEGDVTSRSLSLALVDRVRYEREKVIISISPRGSDWVRLDDSESEPKRTPWNEEANQSEPSKRTKANPQSEPSFDPSQRVGDQEGTREPSTTPLEPQSEQKPNQSEPTNRTMETNQSEPFRIDYTRSGDGTIYIIHEGERLDRATIRSRWSSALNKWKLQGRDSDNARCVLYWDLYQAMAGLDGKPIRRSTMRKMAKVTMKKVV